jgi:hypothetical protein
VKKLAVIVAALWVYGAVLFSYPTSSFAWSSGKYAKQLVNANCGGQSSHYKNGCNAYFAKRLDKTKYPRQRIEWLQISVRYNGSAIPQK